MRIRHALPLPLLLAACAPSVARTTIQTGPASQPTAAVTTPPARVATPPAPTTTPAATVTPVSNSTAALEGELRTGDDTSSDGRFRDVHRVSLRAGERIRVDLTGSFDTFLVVRPPDGSPELENDDVADGDLNSRVEFTARTSGQYEVVATSYAPRATGRYHVTVRAGTAIPAPPAPTGPAIQPGVLTRGRLEQTDSPGQGGRFADEYRFDGRRGDLVVIDLASAAFDTIIRVRGPNGENWISDDINGADTNSRVQATLTADGTYGVTVSSYRPGVSGDYTLRLDRAAQPTRTTDGSVLRASGPRGMGAVYGIYVGIRDYGGEAGDLPHCDEDASLLARSMRDAGVQTAEQQVVLTNADATPDGVRRAFAQMNSRIGPDDVLVFFYSGHGSQVRGTVSAVEPDGLDETIRLRTGGMRDDEMAALVAPIRGTVLFALDSCYSGGFARDIVSGPRRIGIFSSEEDILSNVADRYNAGGYLSYWLRLGVSGVADADRDGSLRVGELTDYLFGMFGSHRSETSTTGNGGGRTYQNVVVARGSVVNTDLLFRYPQQQ